MVRLGIVGVVLPDVRRGNQIPTPELHQTLPAVWRVRLLRILLLLNVLQRQRLL